MEVQCPPPSPYIILFQLYHPSPHSIWDTDLFSWMFPHGKCNVPHLLLISFCSNCTPAPTDLISWMFPHGSTMSPTFSLYHSVPTVPRHPPHHLGYLPVLLDVSSWKCNVPHLLLISFCSNCTTPPPHTTWDTDLFFWMFTHGSAMSNTFSLYHSVPTVPCPPTPPGILTCSPGCILMEVQCPPPSPCIILFQLYHPSPHTTWDTDLFSWMFPHGSAMSPTFSLYHSIPSVPPLPLQHLGY